VTGWHALSKCEIGNNTKYVVKLQVPFIILKKNFIQTMYKNFIQKLWRLLELSSQNERKYTNKQPSEYLGSLQAVFGSILHKKTPRKAHKFSEISSQDKR
jgi:hypothetical protein